MSRPMTGLQSAFNGGEYAPQLNARVDLAKFKQGCRLLRNFKVQPHGGAVKRPGFILLDALPGEAKLLRFVFNQDQTYCLAFGEHWLRVFTPDGPVLTDADQIYEIASPYSLAQAKEISAAQSADILFLACEGVAPQMLKRFGHNHWEFEAMSFDAPLAAPTGFTAWRSHDGYWSPYTYCVTAVDAEGKESEVSAKYEIGGAPPNNWPEYFAISMSWNIVPGAAEYRVYKAQYGGRPGYIATVSQPATDTTATYHDSNVAPSLSEGPPEYENPFPHDDYPRVVSFFEQRLVFASSPNRPQTIWMSKSGDYRNFARYKPQAADSPWEGTIVGSDVSRLNWMVALRSLVVGADMTEWEISASQGAFSAETAQRKPQSYIGSARMPAIIVGNTILHIDRSGAQVRNFQYSFAADSYEGSDCSIMASHLFERYRITDWTYQQHPDSVVWAVREDGLLLGMTYQYEHQVIAWHRHDTQGEFVSVCATPHGRDDILFAVIRRQGQYFLERLADRYIDGDYSLNPFLDCALIYDQPGVEISVVRGLEHLEGMRVGILSRGAVETDRVVTDGSVTLDKPSDRVIVGLQYTADLETMPTEIVGQEGTSVGRKKQINKVGIRFHETVHAKVGVSFDELETVKWRSNEPHGTPPRPFSNDKMVTLPTMADKVVSVCVRSDEPTPMTVLALMPDIKVF